MFSSLWSINVCRPNINTITRHVDKFTFLKWNFNFYTRCIVYVRIFILKEDEMLTPMQSCGLCSRTTRPRVLDDILATTGCGAQEINVLEYDLFLPFSICFFYFILYILINVPHQKNRRKKSIEMPLYISTLKSILFYYILLYIKISFL